MVGPTKQKTRYLHGESLCKGDRQVAMDCRMVKNWLKITPLVKNPRANSLQSLITNLQLSTILPAQISSRPLHHPANPLYQIFLHSHSLSTSCHYSSQVLQSSNIQHCTTSLERPTS